LLGEPGPSLLRPSSVFIMRRVREPESDRVTRMLQVLWHTRGLNPYRAFQYYRHVFANTIKERAARATNGRPPVDDNKMGEM